MVLYAMTDVDPQFVHFLLLRTPAFPRACPCAFPRAWRQQGGCKQSWFRRLAAKYSGIFMVKKIMNKMNKVEQARDAR